MKQYTDNPETIVFLKDSDIACHIEGTTASGKEILSNAVPSFDLLSSLYQNLSSYDDRLCSYIKDCVDVSCNSLCIEVSFLRSETTQMSGDICLSAFEISTSVSSIAESLSDGISSLSSEMYSRTSHVSSQADLLCAYIRDGVDISCNSLCNEVKDLRDETEKLSNDVVLCAEMLSANVAQISIGLSTSIDQLSTQVYDRTTHLSGQIDSLWADVKGGVNYKGHLSSWKADETEYPVPLSDLFKTFYKDDINKELNNGWMYLFSTKAEGGKYTTLDGLELEDKDYLIIHNHKSEALSSVIIKDITRDSVDVIDTADTDYVRFSLLNTISTLLSSNDHYLSGKLDDLKAKAKADDDYLSNEISTTVFVKDGSIVSNKLSVIGIGLDDYSAAIASSVHLSGNQLFVVSSDHVEAFGQQVKHVAVPTDGEDATTKSYVDALAKDMAEDLSTTVGTLYVHKAGDENLGKMSLSGMLSASAPITTTKSISAALSLKSGDEISSITIYPKKIVEEVTDLNTGIKSTYEFVLPKKSGTIALSSEVYELSSALSGDIRSLSTALSTDILSLSGSLSSRIEDLSAMLSGDVQSLSSMLSIDVQSLSTVLSTDIKLSAEDLASQIAGNDADIEFLSNDLSTLEWQHYNGTLSAIDRIGDLGHISSDNLIITDPAAGGSHVHQKFYLTYSYGTMVLKKF